MAYQVNWSTKVISIPTSDLTPVSGNHYSLQMLDFLIEIRRLEAEFNEGLWAPQILDHTNPKLDFAGTNYAGFDEITNGYTVQVTGSATRVDLLGSNNNFIDILIATGVSIVPSNSQGLQIVNVGSGLSTEESAILEGSAFESQVTIDVVNGVPGTGYITGYPIGTRSHPVNNWADAHQIAINRDLRNFCILSDTTIATENFTDNLYNFCGGSAFVKVTIDATANVTNCNFNLMIIDGELDGVNLVRECAVGNVTQVSGIFEKASFTGNITLSGPTYLFECYSQVPGSDTPVVDVGPHPFILRAYYGSMTMNNAQTGHLSSMGVYGGQLVLNPSCVGGNIHARGEPFQVLDNSGVGCTLHYETGNNKVQELHQICGLDRLRPLTVTPTSRTSGVIDQSIGGDGATLTTLDRND